MTAARLRLSPRAGIALSLLLIAGFFHLAWLGSIDVWRIDRDWRGFFRAGELLLAGDHAMIYQARGEGEYPAAFVYPPPMLWPFMALAWLGPPAAYALLTGTSLLSLTVVLGAIANLLPAPRPALQFIGLAAIATAPWMTMLFVGQLSMITTACFVLGFVAWSRGRDALAGLAFGLLLCKPTLAFAPPLLALLCRRWRILAGIAVVGVVLVAASLPLGIDLWAYWLAATGHLSARLREHTTLWKHTTLYAFWRAAVGGGQETLLVRGLWVLGSAGLVLAAGAIILRRPLLPTARLMTVAVLLTVTVTPYLFYYDQMLLLPAAAAWYLGRTAYRSQACWQVAGAALLACCGSHYVSLYALHDFPPLAGVCNAIWFAAELWDLRAPHQLMAPGL